jgi:hypothetical protein
MPLEIMIDTKRKGVMKLFYSQANGRTREAIDSRAFKTDFYRESS